MRRKRIGVLAAASAAWLVTLSPGQVHTALGQEHTPADVAPARDVAETSELSGAPEPGGLWYGFAVGWAWSRVGCEVCRGNLVGGASGMIRGGITQSRSLDLGLEVNGWHRNHEGVERWQGVFSLMAYWYPGPARRLLLKAGFGMTLYRASDSEDAFTSTAFGPQLGFGYELPISDALTFTPQVDVAAAGIGGNLNFNGEPLGSGNYQLVRLAVGITWH